MCWIMVFSYFSGVHGLFMVKRKIYFSGENIVYMVYRKIDFSGVNGVFINGLYEDVFQW